MVSFRWIFGLPIAALITAGLFAFMAGLIQQNPGALAEPRETPKLQILPREREPNPPIKEIPKSITQDPPETIIPPAKKGDKPNPTPIGPLPGVGDPGEIISKTPIGAPVIKHAPMYPEACRSRAAEGVVLVQFDVTPEGGVVNIQIIESANPCFNRTVRNTVSKWKYPPAYQNGRPVMRYGVVEQISFQLTE